MLSKNRVPASPEVEPDFRDVGVADSWAIGVARQNAGEHQDSQETLDVQKMFSPGRILDHWPTTSFPPHYGQPLQLGGKTTCSVTWRDYPAPSSRASSKNQTSLLRS